MVNPDWSAGPRPPQIVVSHVSRPNLTLLARPLDRLAAAIIDVFVIMIPFFLLVSAPLKRGMMTSFLLGSEADFIAYIIGMFLLAMLLVVAYQSISHHYFGRTIGKRIFDLRVIPMFPGERITFSDHIVRSMVWIFELVVCFGLPWLAVFSNPKRRPLHDRLCDTIVVTHSESGVTAPALWERGLVRGLFAAFLGIFTLMLFIQVRGALDKIKMEKSLSAIVERDLGDCEVVSDAVADDPSDDEHHRLKKAMTLYAAGLADRSCLEAEVEGEIARQVPVSPVTYLAQAFIYADDAEVSNSYLDEVCELAPGTVECAMSQLVTSWSDEDWSAVEENLRSTPKGSGYMEVWGVRHFMKQARYSDALAFLDELISRRELAEFTLVQRVKALFNAYRESEAVAAFQQAAVALPGDQAEDLGAWMCAQQLQSTCSARENTACNLALPKTESQEIDFQRPAFALASLLSLECRGDQNVDYLSFSEAVKDEDWQEFFRANLKRQRQDRESANALFTKVVKSVTAPDILKIESARRLLQSSSHANVQDVVDLWRDFDSREGYVKVGNLLFQRLAEQKNSKLALTVARHLLNDQSLSPEGLKVLTAWTDLDAPATTPPTRQPASQAKDQVKQILDAMEKEE